VVAEHAANATMMVNVGLIRLLVILRAPGFCGLQGCLWMSRILMIILTIIVCEAPANIDALRRCTTYLGESEYAVIES
jgi:hypothetical protein